MPLLLTAFTDHAPTLRSILSHSNMEPEAEQPEIVDEEVDELTSSRRRRKLKSKQSKIIKSNRPIKPAPAFTQFEFTERQFKEGFDPKDFIEALSRKLVYDTTSAAEKSDDQLFDPEPFLDAFEKSSLSLQDLRTKVDRHISHLVKECADTEREFKNRLGELNQSFEKSMNSFKDLDTRINRISNMAVRIGGSLEGVDQQRTRGIEVREMLQMIIEMNEVQGRPSKFAELDRLDEETAVLVKKLGQIASELDLKQTESAKSTIEKLNEDLERHLLHKFSTAMADKKRKVMKDSAHLLHAFNGGESCTTAYLAQLSVFQTLDWGTIDVDGTAAPAPRGYTEYCERMTKFFAELQRACRDEIETVIPYVFPQPDIVMHRLVMRVFEQKVQIYMDGMLSEPNMDPHLRLLLLTESSKRATQLGEALNKLIGHGLDVDYVTDSLFANYRADYIVREMQAMTNQFHDWTTNQSKPVAPGSRTLEPDISILSGDATLPFFERSDEAVERCLMLSPLDELPVNMFKIYQTLVNEFAVKFIFQALDGAIRRLPSTEVKLVPSSDEFFACVRIVNTVIVQMHKFFYEKIRPHLESSRNQYTLGMGEKNKMTQLFEDKIVEGLNKLLLVITGWLERVFLKTQRKRDFKPKQETFDLSQSSKACQEVCLFLRRQHAAIVASLDGLNAETYLIELGNRVLKTLLKHVKKFTIAHGEGGLALMRDMREYCDLIAKFNVPTLNSNFQILEAIAKLHLLAPEQLPNLIQETGLKSMSDQDIYDFVRHRSDFNLNWVGKWINKPPKPV